MTQKTIPVATLILTLTGLAFAPDSSALNEPTHELINRHAAISPTLEDMLNRDLGFGLDKQFKGTTVLRWLELGGTREDSPLCRTTRHFHDPLHQADGTGRGPWGSAGLRALNPIIVVGCGGTSFPSSVHWAQEANQTLGERGAWQDARRYFRDALRGSG